MHCPIRARSPPSALLHVSSRLPAPSLRFSRLPIRTRSLHFQRAAAAHLRPIPLTSVAHFRSVSREPSTRLNRSPSLLLACSSFRSVPFDRFRRGRGDGGMAGTERPLSSARRGRKGRWPRSKIRPRRRCDDVAKRILSTHLHPEPPSIETVSDESPFR